MKPDPAKPAASQKPAAPGKGAPSTASGQAVVLFLGLAVVFFGAGIAYKLTHRHHAQPAGETVAVAPVPAVAPAPPSAPPAVPKQQDLIKQGVQNPVFAVRAQLENLGPALQIALNNRTVTLKDIDKLDFGPPGAGVNPDYNVFNPQGKIAFKPRGGKWITQDMLDAMTGKSGSKMYYNLRRVVDRYGSDNEIIYAIVPNISAKNCGAAVGVAEYAVNESLAIEPDTRQIVEDPDDMPIIKAGCISAPGQPLVWFYEITMRVKAKNAKTWSSRSP
jgi:hypothetical protein